MKILGCRGPAVESASPDVCALLSEYVDGSGDWESAEAALRLFLRLPFLYVVVAERASSTRGLKVLMRLILQRRWSKSLLRSCYLRLMRL